MPIKLTPDEMAKRKAFADRIMPHDDHPAEPFDGDAGGLIRNIPASPPCTMDDLIGTRIGDSNDAFREECEIADAVAEDRAALAGEIANDDIADVQRIRDLCYEFLDDESCPVHPPLRALIDTYRKL